MHSGGENFDPWSLVGLQNIPTEDDEPLLSIRVIEGIEPLDDQFGAYPPKTVPDVLYEPLFGQPEPTEAEIAVAGGNPDLVPPMQTYAILDAAKLVNLPIVLETSGLEHRCLFKGEAYEELKDVAPWIVRLQEGNDFTRHLFTKGKAPWFLWDKEPGIYVRSRGTLDDMWRHFRKIVRLQNYTGKWVYFRFWEPEVLLHYLRGISKRPERINYILQTAAGDNIETIIIDSLQSASIMKPSILDLERVSGPMVLDEHDMIILQNTVWHAFSREIGQWASNAYPDRFSNFSKKQIQTFARHVVSQGNRFGCVNKEDFVYLAHMMMTLGGWFYLSGYPAPLISILQDDEKTTENRLKDAFLPAYETLPMAQLTQNWDRVKVFIQSIPVDKQIKPSCFQEFVDQFLPNHGEAVKNLKFRTSHQTFYQELETNDQGKYLILALVFGDAFQADPLHPWANRHPIEAIEIAWKSVFS